MTDTLRIEALWYEPGTAADAAAAANLHRDAAHRLSAQGVREIWEKAKAEGRLPPFDRPLMGPLPHQVEAFRAFMRAKMERAA